MASLGLMGGCQTSANPPSLFFRDREHDSSKLFDSGAQPRVTRKQAADVQYAMGRSLEGQDRFDEAHASYLAAVEKDPKRADAELRLAILDDRKGNPTAADQHFARALKLKPDDPEILCDRGYSLYLRRRWGDAEASLKQALAVDPANARAHSNLGLVMACLGDNQAALAEFARAGCDPSDARSNLGLVLAMEGRLDEAKKEYVAALGAKPKSEAAREGLKATIVALNNGQAETRTLVNKAPNVDPALVQASTTSVAK